MQTEKYFAGRRIKGARPYQEDDFAWDNSRHGDFLMVLSDGMGGYQGGDIASHVVVKSFVNHYANSFQKQKSISRRLYESLHQANYNLSQEVIKHPNLKGMGCTCLAMAFYGKEGKERIEWVSVGDSPLWLYRAGHLTRINADHSMKPILEHEVEQDRLTKLEAIKHPERNVLRSALMGQRSIDIIDLAKEPIYIFPGDTIILASDGLLSLSDEKIIQCIVENKEAKTMVNCLLNKIICLNKKGQDNATAVLLTLPRNEKGKSITSYWKTVFSQLFS